MLYLVKDIEYFLDDPGDESIVLPESMLVEVEDETLIADAVSDETGFLVKSFNYEIQ